MAGTITAIATQARNPRRVNVFVDGVYAFPVSVDVATEAGLKRGMALSDEDIADLVAKDVWQKTYDAALNFLSYRPRSEAEVRRYLSRRRVPADLSERLVNRLKESGLVDDVAFAHYWVENREAFSPRSRRALQAELRSKGVNDSAIAASLPEDDEAAAYRAGQKKARALAGLDHMTFQRKLLSFLQRRGFSYETAREASNRLWRALNEEEQGSCGDS